VSSPPEKKLYRLHYGRAAEVGRLMSRLCEGSSLSDDETDALACSAAAVLRELGYFVYLGMPQDAIERDGRLTRAEAEDVIGRLSDYDHIWSAVNDAIDDAIPQVISDREKGGAA